MSNIRNYCNIASRVICVDETYTDINLFPCFPPTFLWLAKAGENVPIKRQLYSRPFT